MIRTLAAANRVTYFPPKNKIVCKKLADHLIKSRNDCIILPFIDHPGHLSKEIVARQFGSLTLCERDSSIRKEFSSFLGDQFYGRNIRIYGDDLFDLSFKSSLAEAQNRCSYIVNETLKFRSASPDSSSQEDTDVKFLVPLLKSKNEIGFLRNIYYQMSLRMGLCSNTLLHYYFLMSGRQYRYLRAKPSGNFLHYRSSTILYNTIFDLQTLDSFNLRDCFGIKVKKIQNTSRANDENYDEVHLLWLKPRSSILNSMSPKSLIEFRFLVSQMMQRRTCKVIIFLERWFRLSFDELSQLNIDDSTRTGDLDWRQYHALYLFLKAGGHFANSSFLQAAAMAEENLLSYQDQYKTIATDDDLRSDSLANQHE